LLVQAEFQILISEVYYYRVIIWQNLHFHSRLVRSLLRRRGSTGKAGCNESQDNESDAAIAHGSHLTSHAKRASWSHNGVGFRRTPSANEAERSFGGPYSKLLELTTFTENELVDYDICIGANRKFGTIVELKLTKARSVCTDTLAAMHRISGANRTGISSHGYIDFYRLTDLFGGTGGRNDAGQPTKGSAKHPPEHTH
jgi:hypothetical protein